MPRKLMVSVMVAIIISSVFVPAAKKNSCQALDLVSMDDPFAKRADFEFPADKFKTMIDKFGFPPDKFGFTADEMANFYNTSYKLNLVQNLFRDVTMVPRFAGRYSDMLYDNRSNLQMLSYGTMSILDAGSGRGEVAPEDWDVDWLPAETEPVDALDLILKHDQAGDTSTLITKTSREAWKTLPEEVQRFSIRMIIASIKANAFLKNAYNFDFFKKAIGEQDFLSNRRKLYDFVMHPFFYDVSSPNSLKAIDNIDLKYLSYADSVYFAHMTKAIDDIRKWLDSKPNFALDETIRFRTSAGWVGIHGTGDDKITNRDSILIDLGGSDTYSGLVGTPVNTDLQVGACVDFSGNDIYDGGTDPAQLSCGFFGIGLLADLGGDDTYKGEESNIATGIYGSSMLVDFEGSDTYDSGYMTQGCGIVGSGLLLDHSGNDSYTIKAYGQAFANTLGVGILFDVAGNDNYKARDDGNPQAIYNDATLSFSLGSSQGRRADFGDGHNLAGGVGIAIDYEGDDNYYGGCYTEGNAYWWGLGILEDRKGNDNYRCLQYSLGGAPHFSIGCVVDFQGNDNYNVGNDKARFQFQGHGRDGSVGIAYDGSGNDHYYMRNMCAGCGDLNSIAVFWDRAGDDIYDLDERPPYDFLGPCGTVTLQPKTRTFRDTMKTVGLFIDSAGKDTYNHVEDDLKRPNRALCKSDSEWWTSKDPVLIGYGVDREWYK